MMRFIKEYLKDISLLVVILVITFIAFWPTLHAEFVNWDDGSHLYDNLSIQTLDEEHIGQIFTTLINKTYIPLTMFSYAIEHHFFGLDPFVYHLNNVILHLLVVIGVYILTKGFGLSTLAAAVATAVFALHPTRVESVAWVTERKDVLYAFFYILSLICYQKHLLQFNEKLRAPVIENRYVYLTGLFGILSLLAKPMALSLPLILVLMDWFAGRKFDQRAIVEKIPIFILTAGITGITYFANARVPGENILSGALTWFWTFTFYFRQFVTPIITVPLWVNPKPVVITNPEYLASIALTILILFSVWKFRRHKWYVFAFAFFYLSVFFLLRYDDVADKNVVADRFLYLSSFGFCCLVGLGAEKLLMFCQVRSKIFVALSLFLVFGIISVFAFRTYQLSHVWKTSKTLWVHQLKYFPDTPIALNNLAIILSDEEKYQQELERYKQIVQFRAKGESIDFEGKNLSTFNHIKHLLDLYHRALTIKPDYVDTTYNLANLYMHIGNYQAAYKYYTKSIELDPEYKEAYYNLGVLYQKMGQDKNAVKVLNGFLMANPKDITIHEGVLSVYNKILNEGGSGIYKKARDQAFRQYSGLISGKKGSAVSYFKLGYMYNKMGDQPRAMKSYQMAIQMKPNYTDAIYNLANIHEGVGEFKKAAQGYQKVIRLNPQHDLAHLNLGVVYSKMGRMKEARVFFQKALALQPDNADAYFNLGYVFENEGDTIKASEAYKKAIEANPQHSEAYFNLGNIYTKLSLYAKAQQSYQSALTYNPEHLDAMINLSLLAYQTGDFSTAIQYIDEARVLGYDPPAQLLEVLSKYRN